MNLLTCKRDSKGNILLFTGTDMVTHDLDIFYSVYQGAEVLLKNNTTFALSFHWAFDKEISSLLPPGFFTPEKVTVNDAKDIKDLTEKLCEIMETKSSEKWLKIYPLLPLAIQDRIHERFRPGYHPLPVAIEDTEMYSML